MKNSIKRRWFYYYFLSNFIVLLIMTCVISWSMCKKYNTVAENYINSNITPAVETFFKSHTDDESFRLAAKNFVEDFEFKDVMEVWVIDKDGNVISSSRGFVVTENKDMWPDYTQALSSKNGKAYSKINTSSTEPATAMSHILRNEDGIQYGALRYIISTQDTSAQLIVFLFVIFFSFVIINLFIANTGMFFVSSIVNPVSKICSTTREIAKGNFEVRIENNYNDEIGELCNSINDMAIQLSQIENMKNEFISTVSHEIRTPLTAIKCWGETISNFSNDEELTKKGIEVIIDETNRLSGIVEQLLDFSSIQSESIKIVKNEVEINRLLEKAYNIYKQKASEENIEMLLTTKRQAEIFVTGDENKLLQVFVNILDNAVKYKGTGDRILINYQVTGDKIYIRFIDNGIGISADDLPYVKDKFYKANNAIRGAGIGLSVCDKIIKFHSGELNIYSTLGKGTTAEVVLPVC